MYDQSWMGYGWIGGLQAGAIAALAGAVLLLLLRWRTRRSWSHGAQMAWAYLVAVALAGGGDLANMFYLNYARLQSLQLLRVVLAQMHDPDGLGTRVLCELLGAAVGIGIAWAISERSGRRR
jgi:multisubunit Na+/H+ antiporter MnhB subunit